MHLANGGAVFFILVFALLGAGAVVFTTWYQRLLAAHFFPSPAQRLMLLDFNPLARRLRTAALLTAVVFISLSLLDPRWGSKGTQAGIEGIDVVLVMDISRSMTTPDVQPSRLEYAKRLSQQLMGLLSGNRIGITAFAGFAFNVIPLTTDDNAASLFLNELSSDMIDLQGTHLEDALKKALDLFDKEALTHKAIVVFTDGEDMENSPMKQVKAARERGIPIFCIGIGTPAGGPVPLYDANGNFTGYLQENGVTVTSKLNDALMGKIASETHGLYMNGDENAIITLARRLDELQKTRFGTTLYEFIEPQFQIFLGLAVAMLLLVLMLPERRLNGSFRLSGVLLGLIIFSFAQPAQASEKSDGVAAYKKKEYEAALEHFQKGVVKDPKNNRLRYNEANTRYQLNQMDEAASIYGKLAQSPDKDLRLKSLFNLGSAYLEKKDYTNALRAFGQVYAEADPKSELSRNALRNIIYTKQPKPKDDQNKDQNKDDKNNQNQNSQSSSGQQNSSRNQQNSSSGQNNSQGGQKSSQAQKPLTPSDVDNLLNLIEEEEKKHLSRKEKPAGVKRAQNKEW